MEKIQRKCPACGAEMECKQENFRIGADGRGGLISWRPQYYVDLYSCPQCGKVELYDAEFRQAREREDSAVQDEEVTCPVCGTKHSSLINCPSCALHGRISPPQSEKQPKPEKPGRKPPWKK